MICKSRKLLHLLISIRKLFGQVTCAKIFEASNSVSFPRAYFPALALLQGCQVFTKTLVHSDFNRHTFTLAQECIL